MDYPVHDGVCVGSPAEPAMPILHPVLGAPYRRRFVVATVDELQEEPHLVGVERIHEPLVHDENLVARVLLQHLRFGDAGGQVLLARHQQVGHAHVEGAQAVLAGLPPDRAGEEGLAGSGVADHDDVGCRFHELAGPEAVDGVAGKRPAVVDDAAHIRVRYAEVRPLEQPLHAGVLLLLRNVVDDDAHPLVEAHVGVRGVGRHRIHDVERLGHADDPHLPPGLLVDHRAPPA